MLYHLIGGLRSVGMDGQRMRLAFNGFKVFIPATTSPTIGRYPPTPGRTAGTNATKKQEMFKPSSRHALKSTRLTSETMSTQDRHNSHAAGDGSDRTYARLKERVPSHATCYTVFLHTSRNPFRHIYNACLRLHYCP
jgi:hypothetical protein